MILLKVSNESGHNNKGYGFGYDDGDNRARGLSDPKGDGYGDGKGFGDGKGYGKGNGHRDGNGITNPTVSTDTLHSATVLTVATQLITYYGGRWV